jgi:homocysteine S-methyltransferase
MKIKYPLLIDGGLSNVLEANGCDLNQKLWSAKFIDHYEEEIIKAHCEYLAAGAGCIITSSYQATIPGLIEAGYSQIEAAEIIRKTVSLAEKARASVNGEAFIAASIGPYGAYLSDGSEYSGNYDVSEELLYAFHLSRIEILQQSNCDFFACETIPSFMEAKIIAQILEKSSKPAWVSFSCRDNLHINDGTLISECAIYFAQHPNIFAIGLNCTNPEYVSSLIKEIKPHCGEKRIVVYPNSGELFNAADKSWQEPKNSLDFTEYTKNWLELGAGIIGGCCRIGPAQIADIRKKLF